MPVLHSLSPVYTVYGLTEVSGSISSIPVTDKAKTAVGRKPTSVGPPSVNVEMKVDANSKATSFYNYSLTRCLLPLKIGRRAALKRATYWIALSNCFEPSWDLQ